MLSKGWLAVVFVVGIMGTLIVPSTSATEKKPSSGSHHAAAKPAAGAVSPIPGICDTANVTDVFSDLTDESTKAQQLALLQGRIVECSHKIADALAHLPSPTPTPYWVTSAPLTPPLQTPAPDCVQPPPATMASNSIAMFETLGLCSAYLAYVTALPTPAPVDSPLSSLASRPTFYVFATGAVDPLAASVLIRTVTDRLIKTHRHAAPDNMRIVARADWTDEASFAAQCQLDPNTRGALIIQTSIPLNYRFNYILVIANFTDVSASVEMLGCGDEDHHTAASPLSLFSEQAITAKAHETAYTLGFLSALAPFLFPTKAVTTVAGIGTGSTTVTNTQSATPYFSGNLLASFQAENLNFPAQNPSVQLTVASERFADSTMQRLHAFCSQPDIRTMATAADPKNVPLPPLEHRTASYKAAYEYVTQCDRFAEFAAAR